MPEIKIGQIYKSIDNSNPFVDHETFVGVLDVKKSAQGEDWIKFAYYHDQTLSLTNFTDKKEYFLRMFSLYKDVNAQQNPREVVNAISELEI